MAYVGDIFEAAMGLMDELSAEGEAQTSDTAEYVLRTPAIINMLAGELKMLTGEREDWLPVESLDDAAPGTTRRRSPIRATPSARCHTGWRPTCSWTRTRARRAFTSSAMRS